MDNYFNSRSYQYYTKYLWHCCKPKRDHHDVKWYHWQTILFIFPNSVIGIENSTWNCCHKPTDKVTRNTKIKKLTWTRSWLLTYTIARGIIIIQTLKWTTWRLVHKLTCRTVITELTADKTMLANMQTSIQTIKEVPTNKKLMTGTKNNKQNNYYGH